MQEINFELKGDYIELIQLLKTVNIAQSGGHAKIMVEEGEITFKGEIEQRKRAKLRVGDFILVKNTIKINVV